MATATETTDGGRTALGGEAGRGVAIARLAIGLAQGIALYLLFRVTEGEPSWSERHPSAFAMMVLPALFLPPVLLAAVGRLRPLILAIWGLVAAAVLSGLAWHDVVRQASDAGQPTPQLFAFSAAALFVAHHLLLPADRERRWLAPYPAYFDAAWMAGVQLVASIAFTAAFWLLLFLGAALFNVIGLRFLGDLIAEPWIFLPVTGLAFATAVHLTDVREGLIRGVRTIALMLLSWLLLVLTVLVGGFLIALPFTGLDGLWETNSATALLLAATGALIVLINAAYQDGREDNQPPAALRLAVRAASVLLIPLIAIAAWGLWQRIGQHGLTPDRIIAAACVAIGAVYAGGYAFAALRTLWSKGEWMAPLERTNVGAAVLVVVVILALFSPVADPTRLSVADQVARLEAGKVAPDKFDYAFLQFESGKVGRAALDGLAASSNPEIARRATEAKVADSAYALRDDAEALARIQIEAWPTGSALPAGLINEVERGDPRFDCRDDEACLATVIDLNDDGVEEVLLATRGDLELLAPLPNGQWRHVGSYRLHNCGDGRASRDARELMRQGAIQASAAPEWPALRLGDEVSQLTPSQSCHPAAIGEAVSSGIGPVSR